MKLQLTLALISVLAFGACAKKTNDAVVEKIEQVELSHKLSAKIAPSQWSQHMTP